MQKGDVKKTWEKNTSLRKLINYKANTNIKNGIDQFIRWYNSYYNKQKN